MKNWTIMVYFAGDNNLNLEMAYALEQVKAITEENQNINLYVYFDGFSSNVPTLYCDFSDPVSPVKFYRSSGIKDKLIKRETREENRFNENSASMNNIINFVDWCVKKDKYPLADGQVLDGRKDKKYAMIFSGHSFGFLDWGLFKDEKANYYMTLSKLKWLFERLTFTNETLQKIAQTEQAEQKKTAKENNRVFKPWSPEKLEERETEIIGKPLDLLGFDSCVMSTLEIGSQFKDLTQTMVASQGSIPNAGWNYAQILIGKLKNKPHSDPKEIAVSFVDGFIKQQNKFALADISVDMAAWDLKVLPNLEESFKELAGNLMDCFKEKESITCNQMRRLLTQAHWQCQTYLYEQHIDLGDFCQLLNNEIDSLKTEVNEKQISSIIKVGESCQKVVESLRECVLLTGFSGSDFQFSNGISLFFPWSLASYESARKDYEKLSFIKDNDAGKKWNEFLVKYLSEVTLRKSKPLTQTDSYGNTMIDPQNVSVIYESYTLLNEENDNAESGITKTQEDTKQPPDGTKQPPDGTRQPPDGTRQPPDGYRMSGNMSIFLARFMKLKNFQSNWNQTGFTSSRVKFKPKPEASRQSSMAPVPDIVGEIEIPKATGIEKMLSKILSRMNHGVIDSEFLKEISQYSDKSTIAEILENSSKLNSVEEEAVEEEE